MSRALLRTAVKYAHMWPDITNPLARLVVATAYELVPESVRDKLLQGKEYVSEFGPHQYRDRLRQRLADSDLGSRIVAGQGMLPNIYQEMPLHLRPLEEYFRPRNFQRLTWHVIQYLDWYLNPLNSSAFARTSNAILGKLVIGLVMLPLIVWMMIATHGRLIGFAPMYLPMFLGLLATLIHYPAGMISTKWSSRQSIDEFKINAIEFYLYARAAFADLPEQSVPLPEPNTPGLLPVYNRSSVLHPELHAASIRRSAHDSALRDAGLGR